MEEGYFDQHAPNESNTVDDMPWLSDFIAADPATEDWLNNFPQFAPESAANGNNNATISPFEYDLKNLGNLDAGNDYTTAPNDVVPDMAAPLSVLLQQVQQERDSASAQQRRSLPRKRSTYFKRSAGKSSPIPIMTPERMHSEPQSLAMQRWQDSPPQNEAASLSAIYSALENPMANGTPSSPWMPNFDAFRTYRTPPSLTSVASSVSSRHSADSSRSAASGTSKRSRVTKKTRKPKAIRNETNPEDRIFKCTFYHLVQHLRLFHGIETLPLIEDWKVNLPPISSRCGFCNARLSSWDERVNHLAAHFRQGKTMADWTGDHGFDATTSTRVACALPPYLLADDSRSLVPFSATNPASRDHFNQMLSLLDQEGMLSSQSQNQTGASGLNVMALPKLVENDTPYMFADVLAQHLSQFARNNIMKGIMPTDEMFQREARRVAFGDEDGWNQTLADNREWLKSWKQQEDWLTAAAQLSLN
ncbi:hypothetical protein N0V87_003656 [Didymella glomerata]|uniref:C2H2-type domain-containing protein n=1 Tax=Didymella glomerata TaxID=749621 RepID=A0A9W8X1T9_9PLEO|nr:hypothetical protein N0V87_003656 [Didymella glomerata]